MNINMYTYITESTKNTEVWRIIRVDGEFPLEHFKTEMIRNVKYLNTSVNYYGNNDFWKSSNGDIKYSNESEIKFMEGCISENRFINNKKYLLKNTESQYEIY